MSNRRLFLSAVAIAVKDEGDHIGYCLAALLGQIILHLNTTTDRTAAITRQMMGRGGSAFHLIERTLPPAEANAGTARCLALDAAAELVGDRGVILTDRVAWIVTAWREL